MKYLGYEIDQIKQMIDFWCKHNKHDPFFANTKKEITLYRYTYKYNDGTYYQSGWTSRENCADLRIIKTEQKTIEVDE